MKRKWRRRICKKYSALLLPNTALLSDEQCRQLRAYVDGGGSLLATFETSLYNERNERRADFGLADVFGIHKAGEIVGTTGNAYLARIEKQHAILDGFTNTHWIPGAENRVPVAPVEGPDPDRGARLRGLPAGIILSRRSRRPMNRRWWCGRKGKSRLIYFPGDIERTMWQSGHTDLARLLQNSIRWVAGANPPVTIEGEGVIETFAWETAGRLRRSRSELHESGHAPRLAPQFLPDRRAEGDACICRQAAA